MITKSISLVILLIFLFLNCSNITKDETNIINTVNVFFDALAEQDTAKAASVLTSDGLFHSVRVRDGKTMLRSTSHEEFIKSLSQNSDNFLERMWEPEVLIHKNIAFLWTKYDFHRNKEYSHGGIDAFSLVKTENGWKIAGLTYTIEQKGYENSPLGPIKK